MPKYCLPKEFSTKLQQAIDSGKIEVSKLIDAPSSEARRKMLADVVGETNAREINASFEKTVMLGNQKEALNKWLSKWTPKDPKMKSDMASKIAKMDELLNPADLKAFMEDLVSEKLGANVKIEDVKKLTQLAKDVNDSRTKIKDSEPNGSKNRLNYGAKKEALSLFMNDLKERMTPKTDIVAEFKKPGGSANVLSGMEKELLNSSKAISFSMDISFGLNQGFKTAFISPTSFIKPFFEQPGDFIKGMVEGNNVVSGTRAEIMSRKNALNGIYDDKSIQKLLGTDEYFPEGKVTKFVSKIPVVGNLFRGSEAAFTAAGLKMRANLVDKFVSDGIKAGKDMFDPKELRNVAKNVGAATRKGEFGQKTEGMMNYISPVLTSGKAMKGDFDFIFNPISMGKGSTEYGLHVARVNMLKVVAGRSAMIIALNAAVPGAVNLDPKSSNFLAVKIGNHVIKLDAGVVSAITLLTRLGTGESTSVKGIKTELDTGEYGPNKTRADIVKQFILNRLSPALQAQIGIGSAVVSGKGKMKDQFTFKDTTPTEQILKAYTPLSLQNWQDLGKDPQSSSDDIFYQALDMMGAFTSDYQVK